MAASGRSNAVQPYLARLPAVRGVTIYDPLHFSAVQPPPIVSHSENRDAAGTHKCGPVQRGL
jgi:hypothetical protein